MRPGDRVVLAFPSYNAIRYYFRVRKLDEFLETTGKAQRLFVVVNAMRPNFGVQEILRAAHCPVEQYTTPVALLDMESVQVYELSLR